MCYNQIVLLWRRWGVRASCCENSTGSVRGDMRLRKILVTFFIVSEIKLVCAGVLHIGNISISTHVEKYTTPSLNVMMDGGSVYHIPMTPQNIYGTFHVQSNDIVYSVCVGEKMHVGHYWFIGNCLVDADDDVYLESTNTGRQYIDSGVVPNVNTKMFIDMQDFHRVAELNYMGIRGAFNNNFSILSSGDSGKFSAVIRDKWVTSIDFDNLRHTFELSMRDGYIVDGKYVYYMGNYEFNPTPTQTIYVFGDHITYFAGRVYTAKIYVNDIPVRYFVPVPSGMQIGNYTVPSNGMWDIVEQKFYGNSGTGDFIYGVDE